MMNRRTLFKLIAPVGAATLTPLGSFSEANADTREPYYPLKAGRIATVAPLSNTEPLRNIVDRNFTKEITHDLLSSNIKTMNFREEWQFVVNNLVAEAKIGLRAMVFDVELTRWWNSIAGQVYMMTNMDLLRRKILVKRIFLLSSVDTRLRMNALVTACVHHQIGIDVRVCNMPNFQHCIPFQPDMFSIHDNLFVSLYYFSLEEPITNLLLDDKYISEFTSFYDEIFADDRLCTDIEVILAKHQFPESFWDAVGVQLNLLKDLEKVSTFTELAKKL